MCRAGLNSYQDIIVPDDYDLCEEDWCYEHDPKSFVEMMFDEHSGVDFDFVYIKQHDIDPFDYSEGMLDERVKKHYEWCHAHDIEQYEVMRDLLTASNENGE